MNDEFFKKTNEGKVIGALAILLMGIAVGYLIGSYEKHYATASDCVLDKIGDAKSVVSARMIHTACYKIYSNEPGEQ